LPPSTSSSAESGEQPPPPLVLLCSTIKSHMTASYDCPFLPICFSDSLVAVLRIIVVVLVIVMLHYACQIVMYRRVDRYSEYPLNMTTLGETFNIRTATPYARQRLILDYIIRHPGKSQNQIAAGVRRFMTRQIALKHIKDMTDEGVLIVQKAANGAAFSYFAQFNNPLVKISQEVYEFEPAICALVRSAASQIEFRYWESADGYMYSDVLKLQRQLRPIFDLFKYFVDFYLYRVTIEWRYNVANEETRKELYASAIEAIGRIQEAMFEELRKIGMNRMTLGVLFGSIWGQIDEAKMLGKLANRLEKMGLKKEALDVIEKMPKSLIRPKIMLSYLNVGDGKVKLIAKKRLNEDGSITRLR
jgi:hypothetical protein